MKRILFDPWLKENPVFILLLGLCPVLAVTISVKNAVGMGVAATCVLVCSNTIVSLFGSLFPRQIRIPCFIVVIATFVSMVEMLMAAYFPAINESLGIFIPLIVVNCIILGRAEAFASRNKLIPSLLDGIGMGMGFSIALVSIALIREVLGAGTFWGIRISEYFSPEGFIAPATVMTMAPGAFIIIGLILGVINWRKQTQ